jgi:hypothetical protein
MHSPVLSHRCPGSRPYPYSLTAMSEITPENFPPLTETPPGRYRHYKGMLYDVVGTVRHSESLEPMTLYRALYGEHGLVGAPGGHVQ